MGKRRFILIALFLVIHWWPTGVSAGQITLAFVGDVMFHKTILNSAFNGERYNFVPFFEHVRAFIQEADLAFCNLETTLAGPPYTGYPRFSTPDSALDALKWCGFDVVNVANNHMLDRGIEGLFRTVRKIREAGLHVVGARLGEDERRFTLVNVKGLKVSFAGFTYGTNGLSAPAKYAYAFDYIDEKAVQKTISEMRKVSDVVIVHLHFGDEYTLKPSAEQERIANACIEAGADLVVGTHPHVLQKVEIVRVNGKKKLIAYSLGNFIADMDSHITKLGVILTVTFDVKAGVVGLQPILTWTQKYRIGGKYAFRVIPVEAFLKSGDVYFGETEASSIKRTLSKVNFNVTEK